ncbi:MAG: transposase [bacterium]
MTIPDEFYHVLNRGTLKQNIFFEPDNYRFFFKRLIENLKKYKPVLHAYCLMPNHFHLILQEKEEKGIAKTMHALQTSYAKAINKRLQRNGHLLQGTYKKKHISNNNYLLHLSRYIHLNPVEAGLVIQPEEWNYSSFQEYVGLRKNGQLISDIIVSQFSDRRAYWDFVLDRNNDVDLGGLTLE